MQRFTIAAAASLALLAPSVSADNFTAQGYQNQAVQPVAGSALAYATLGNGNVVAFDGLNVDLYDPAGAFLQSLASVQNFVFPSFIRPDPSQTFVLIGESTNGDVFRVDLAGGGITPLANLFFNFDAAFEADGMALVSAALGGFGAGNDIIRLDPGTGATTTLIHVPGSSGPIAVGPGGHLYYATQSDLFPAPPASTDVILWTKTQLDGGLPLTELDAALFSPGFDGGSSLSFDSSSDHLFIAESVFGAPVNMIHDLDQAGLRVDTPVLSRNDIGNIEFSQGPGTATFQAYQPGDGVNLRYNSVDFDEGTSVTVEVAPARPQLSIDTLGALTTITVNGAKPNGAFNLFWNDVGIYDPNESPLDLGLGFPFHTGMLVNALPRLQYWVPINEDGEGRFSYFDLGPLAGTRVFQTLITDEQLQALGTSTAVFN